MPIFSSVVVGTDGSDTAEAVRRAIELAKLCDATLHIVTAYKPKPVRTAGVPEEFRERLGPRWRRRHGPRRPVRHGPEGRSLGPRPHREG